MLYNEIGSLKATICCLQVSYGPFFGLHDVANGQTGSR